MISKERIKLLPKWCLTETHPAFYDVDSKTAVGQTARVYAAMLELQEDYNSFVSEINICITDFINNVNADQECFKNQITKIVHDYIAMLDEKLKLQDKEIQESIVYIKDNLQEGIKEVINEMVESGELENAIVDAFDNLGARVTMLENSKVKMVYNSETESLNFENVEVEIV